MKYPHDNRTQPCDQCEISHHADTKAPSPWLLSSAAADGDVCPPPGWQAVLPSHRGHRKFSIRVPPIYCGINLDRCGSVAPLKLNFLDAKQPMDANVA